MELHLVLMSKTCRFRKVGVEGLNFRTDSGIIGSGGSEMYYILNRTISTGSGETSPENPPNTHPNPSVFS